MTFKRSSQTPFVSVTRINWLVTNNLNKPIVSGLCYCFIFNAHESEALSIVVFVSHFHTGALAAIISTTVATMDVTRFDDSSTSSSESDSGSSSLGLKSSYRYYSDDALGIGQDRTPFSSPAESHLAEPTSLLHVVSFTFQ